MSLQHRWMSPCAALTRGYSLPDHAFLEKNIEPVAADIQLSFYLGNVGLLCPLDEVTDIAFPPPVFRIPNTLQWMQGLVNHRGQLIPVIDLHIVLGLSAPPKSKSMMIVFGKEDHIIGIFVDGLPRRLMIEHRNRLETLPPLPPLLKDYVFTAYRQNNETWLKLDHVKLFDLLAQKVTA